MRTHGIVTQIQQPYSTLSFGTSPWINPIAPIQPVSRATITRPHKSIQSPGSSQCRALPLLSPTNQFHHSIQSRAMIAHPHNSIPLPTSSQCHIPMACPHKSIQSRRSSRVPPWRVPINQYHRLVQPVSRAPINQTHRPDPAMVANPHCAPLWINPITPIQPMLHGPMACPHESIPSPQSSQCRMPPWINPISLLQPVSRIPMAQPHQSIPSPRSSRAPSWGIPINRSNRPARAASPHGTPP